MLPPTTTNAGLHVRYEKDGLILDSLPIPGNADAAIIEAMVRMPAGAPRQKQDFTLQWADCDAREQAELVVDSNVRKAARVLFRFPTPQTTVRALIFWRDQPLGEIEVPVVAQSVIVEGVTIDLPTIHAWLGGRAVVCRTMVSGQAKNVFASALLRSRHALAATSDSDLRVQVVRENGAEIGAAPVTLTSEEMRTRQTLITVQMPKLRGVGAYGVSWQFASRTLSTQRIRIVSKRTFLRSLRVSAARFQITMTNGALHTVRELPGRDGKLVFDGIQSIRPVFYVSSGEVGMAGLAPFTLRALVDDVVTTLAIEQDVLVTDGLRPIAFDEFPVNQLLHVKHFTLATGDAILGNLALVPAPTADFTAEGGFAPLDDFLWSPAAEEQLNDRLGKLLDGE